MKIKIIPGDILVVDRGFYRYYGIYAGKNVLFILLLKREISVKASVFVRLE
jgi:hypothetical protein